MLFHSSKNIPSSLTYLLLYNIPPSCDHRLDSFNLQHFIYEPNEAQNVSELWIPAIKSVNKTIVDWERRWKYCSILLINFFLFHVFYVEDDDVSHPKKGGESKAVKKGGRTTTLCAHRGIEDNEWVATAENKVENMKWAIIFCNETILFRRRKVNEELRLVLRFDSLIKVINAISGRVKSASEFMGSGLVCLSMRCDASHHFWKETFDFNRRKSSSDIFTHSTCEYGKIFVPLVGASCKQNYLSEWI